MRILYCADPWNILSVDPMYENEMRAAEETGQPFSLIHFEALVDEHNPQKAVRRVEAAPSPETGIYRGWMLKPSDYHLLYEALLARNIQLVNSPEQYRHCHYLPESYPIIQAYTPRTVWLPVQVQVEMDAVMNVLKPFGKKPVIVKDFVKSRKHEWFEACYIPDASNREAVERVVRRFVELQGDDLHEGLVFREFVEFEPLSIHSKSGMPLTKEYRLFFLDGQLCFSSEYWEEGAYNGQMPPVDLFTRVAQRVQSRFFSMDVARCVDGSWMIVELGDGQVAGLPERADIGLFYRQLAL